MGCRGSAGAGGLAVAREMVRKADAGRILREEIGKAWAEIREKGDPLMESFEAGELDFWAFDRRWGELVDRHLDTAHANALRRLRALRSEGSP